MSSSCLVVPVMRINKSVRCCKGNGRERQHSITPVNVPLARINVEKVMNKVKTMNIALIGYGFVGKTFHAPLIQSVEGLKLAVVSSRDEEKVKRDLPDVLVVATPEEAIQHPDIDLVVIASPNATHAPLATLALNAGKHVVVDKPFTLDMQEARDLIALAQENSACSRSFITAAGIAIFSALSR